MSGDAVRRRFRFVGHVQGVGFRYLTRKLAEERNCTGWVRNEMDGSVRAEIQGDSAAIEEILAALADHYNGTPWLGGFDVDEDARMELVQGEAGFVSRYA